MEAILTVAVKGCDKTIVIERTIDLPFMPVVGLSLCGITCGGSNVWDCPIKSVIWDVSLNVFHVTLEDDTKQVGTQTAREMIDEEWGDEWRQIC